VTIDRIGRRSYLRGTPFAAKDAIRAAGAKWDADERSWWVGSADKAAEIVAKIAQAAPQSEDARKAALLAGCGKRASPA